LPGEFDDEQPLEWQADRLTLTAHARIDNCDELVERLGMPFPLSDPEMILQSWRRWGCEAPFYLTGDFSFAIWDDAQRELTLTRSPISSRNLYYRPTADHVLFATLPQPLNRFGGSLNVDELAARLAGASDFGSRASLISDVYAVEPGTCVRINRSSVRVSRYWDPEQIEPVQRRREDAADELKWHFERAVRACLRRQGGRVGTHLSGGRDSGAVTSTAAALLAEKGETLFAYTAAPRSGFRVQSKRHLFDESMMAAAVARRHRNLHHKVSRTTKLRLGDRLDEANRLHAAPMGNTANLDYWCQILSLAKQDGVRVLLTGSNGNFSISVGGLGALSDVIREEGVRGWSRAVRRLRMAGVSWTTILNQSFGHEIPPMLHRALRKAASREILPSDCWPFCGELLEKLRHREVAGIQSRPLTSYRRRVQEICKTIDYNDHLGVGLFGIDIRDPTADRRLVEFCLSLPASDIVGSQAQRPIYDLAFRSLIPEEVRCNPLKGFQGADWLEMLDPEELRSAVRRYGQNAAVREFIDLGQIEALLDHWPSDHHDYLRSYKLYANDLLGAISVASWLYVNS
jgi:asparagine synthase (glutamine-hydrolysing)